MQINEATKRATATRRESDERNSSMTRMGAEIGTAADGQTKAERRRLMETVVERNNLWLAYERVMRNKGAAGVDGLGVFDFKAWLQQHWPSVKAALLSNILLTDLDRELERRGHCFCRYADDCNIYVKSEVAGQHAMDAMTGYLEKKLKLQVNRNKSAVARPWQRKFLGYSVTRHKQTCLKIADSSLTRLKDRVREIIVGNSSRNLGKTIDALNPVLRGWMSYFRLTEVRGVLQELDGWIRRKLRCLLWRQWKRPATRNRKLQAVGLNEMRARKSAGNGRGPWWNAGASHMNVTHPKRFFDALGLVSLLDTQQRFQHV